MFRILIILAGIGLAGCTTLPPPSSPGAPIELNSDVVSTVQQSLNDRGFDAGAVDGMFGKRTETALRAFEESKGLPVDGVLDSTAYTYLTQQQSGGDAPGSGSSGGQGFAETFSGLFGGSAQAAGNDSKRSAGGGQSSSTTGRGAAIGAAIGGAAGYLGGDAKTAIIGAAIGAFIGNLIEHQRVRSSQQVYEEYGSDSRVVLNDVRLSRDVIQPGETGKATVMYDVVAPDRNTMQSITHTMEYYQGDTRLASNTEQMQVATGGYETVFPLAVPEGAEEGEYRLVAQVRSPDAEDRKERSFQVIYALNEQGGIQIVSVQ